jgi:hypothetical protein
MLLCSNALFVIRAQAGPGLGSGSHIEAQIGTQFSALGSHCRFLACVEDAQRLRLPSAPLPGGGLPVCTGPDLRKNRNLSREKIATIFQRLNSPAVMAMAQRRPSAYSVRGGQKTPWGRKGPSHRWPGQVGRADRSRIRPFPFCIIIA